MKKRRITVFVMLGAVLAAMLILASCKGGASKGTGNTSDKLKEFQNQEMPVFSELGGFYTGKMSVSISMPSFYEERKEYEIRVTYNGSEPNAGSDKYTGGAIQLPGEYAKKTKFANSDQNVSVTVIRAACFDPDTNRIVGLIATATFIQVEKADRFDMPVISLATDPNNLTGRNGLFTNAGGKGAEWERPVNLQYFNKKGELKLSQDAGLRLFGGSSRGLSQKSFKIIARTTDRFNTYRYNGNTKFRFGLFGDDTLKADGTKMASFDSFILRNGGNDSFLTPTEPLRATFMRDGIAAEIAQKAAPECFNMNYKPVVVFLNGEYYGILNMREHENNNLIRNYYDLDDEEKEQVCVISSELDTTRGGRYDGRWFYYVEDDGPEGELEKFEALMKGIGQGKYSYSEVEAAIDVEEFMKYCAVNLFTCNTDWPHNNVKVWRYCGTPQPDTDGLDGKWHFMFKDMDLGLGRYTCGKLEGYPIELYTRANSQNIRLMLCNYVEFDSMKGYPKITENSYPDSLYLQGVLAFLLKNEGFRTAFYNYCKQLATEIWPYEELEKLITDSAAKLDPEIQNYLKKNFGGWAFDITTTYEDWLDAVFGDDSLMSWAKERTGANGEFMKQIDELMTYLG